MNDKLSMEAYKPLIEEIEILEMRIDGLREERELLVKKMEKGPGEVGSISYDGMPKGNAEYKDLARYIEELKRIDSHLELDEGILSIKKATLRKIKKKVENFVGIEHKIAIRQLQGKSLKDIAEELGYSYDWLRKVNAKMQKAQ
jgi:hypothetical protein